jgi:anti-anti-sigma regulatory factor
MASPLQTDVSWDGVVATVTATGELDITAARTLCHELLEVAAARPERLVLDLGGLVLADAAGARALDRAYKLLRAGCPVIVRRPPTWSSEIVGRIGIAGEGRPVPAPFGDLADRLVTARAQAAASYERTRELWQRTESMLVNNKMLRQEVQETCHGWESPSPGRELLQRSAYARLVARLETMPVIEQAKGIIMAQSACSDAEAFDMLRQASQRSNVPVRELAARLVAKSTGVTTSTAAKPRDPAAR